MGPGNKSWCDSDLNIENTGRGAHIRLLPTPCSGGVLGVQATVQALRKSIT